MPARQDPSALSFKVLAEIADGETATVELCRVVAGPAEGRLVAVKRLHPHLAKDPAFVDQFRDEMWMTAALRHPNCVEVVGWGSDEHGLYLAVELVQGVSLARLMKTIFDTGEAFTERMVVFIARQICRGLSKAHALKSPSGEPLNLVHRDLTPGNVLCSFQGDVKIADFGLAKAKQRLTKTLTGMVKGQLEYISPEQALGKEVDARADVFSLGVLLFELFAGRRPWVAANEMELAQLLMTAPPADLLKLRPKIHRELVDIVNKCLDKDPKKRFQSVQEILARFDEWLSSHGYMDDNEEALGRFVRRNAMKQMAWFERAITSSPTDPHGKQLGLLPSPSIPSLKSTPPPAAESSPATARVAAMPKPVAVPSRPSLPGVPKARARIDTAATAVEGKAALAKIASYAGSPVIKEAEAAAADEEGDWGEELPTLIKGTPEQIAQLRQAQQKGKPFDPKILSGQASRPEPIDEETTNDAKNSIDSKLKAQRPPIDDEATNVGGRVGHSEPPPSPATTRSAGSAPPPGAVEEERLRNEAERLSIEAMRLAEEAKAAQQRAERKAALAKAMAESSAVAAEAVRIRQTNGLLEALKRLETALSIETIARANDAAAGTGASVPPPAPVPSLAAMAPPPVPPVAAQAPLVARPAAAPAMIPSAPPVPSFGSGPRTLPSGAVRSEIDQLRGSDQRPAAMSEAETPFRGSTVKMSLPVILAVAVGVVVLVLVLLVIAFG